MRSGARERVVALSWWVGCPDVAQTEAELRDLALLRDVVEEGVAAHAREMVEHEGVSWVVVASALSLAPGAARGRYGRGGLPASRPRASRSRRLARALTESRVRLRSPRSMPAR